MTPSLDNNSLMNTAFEVAGFTGVAGWSFSRALAAGGLGTAADSYQRYRPVELAGAVRPSTGLDVFSPSRSLCLHEASRSAITTWLRSKTGTTQLPRQFPRQFQNQFESP